MKKLSPNIISLLVALIAFSVLLIGINLPFTGQHDWNSVVYANLARTITRFGLDYPKLGSYFFHYPPLLPLSLALSFSIAGISHWSARLVPILSATAMVYFLFKLVHKLWGLKTALFTAIFLTFSPMLLYYSKIPVHETVVLGFIAATLWFYVLWLKAPTKKNYLFLISCLILAQLSSWAGFYLSAYLPLHAFIFKKNFAKKNSQKLLGIFLLAPLLFALHLLHMLTGGNSGSKQSLIDVLLFRLNVSSQSQAFGFTYPKFIELQARWMTIYFTRVMMVLSLLWLINFIKARRQKQPPTLPQSLVLLLLVFGFTHNVLFQNLAFLHDYMLIYALPFFAISSAVSLNWIADRLSSYKNLTAIATIVILVLFTTERLPYLNALFKSGSNNIAYPLSLSLKKASQPQDTILILSSEFKDNYEVFIRYYTDRSVGYASSLDQVNLEDFGYLVIPKSHDYVSQKDKQFLYDNYPNTKVSTGAIFNLKSSQ